MDRVLETRERNIDRMLRVAKGVGCVVESSPIQPIELAGEVVYAAKVRCRDNAHAVELLNAFAKDDAKNDEDLVRFSIGFCPRGTKEERARAVHAFVKEAISFSEEEGERFRLPSVTLRLGTGDCDDSAHLIASLAIACGVEARIVLMHNSKGEASHVVAQLGHDDAWHWAEATFDADYDEHPYRAAKRLGIMRGDVT